MFELQHNSIKFTCLTFCLLTSFQSRFPVITGLRFYYCSVLLLERHRDGHMLIQAQSTPPGVVCPTYQICVLVVCLLALIRFYATSLKRYDVAGLLCFFAQGTNCCAPRLIFVSHANIFLLNLWRKKYEDKFCKRSFGGCLWDAFPVVDDRETHDRCGYPAVKLSAFCGCQRKKLGFGSLTAFFSSRKW